MRTRLQLLLHYNTATFPIYIISLLLTQSWKFTVFQRTFWNSSQYLVLTVIFALLEATRLYLFRRGMRLNRLPDLSASLILTCPLILIAVIMMLQKLFGGGFTTPLELGIGLIYVAFLLFGGILGLLVTRSIASTQAIDFLKS